MRVLITGATGFIGRVLVPILLGEDHQLIALVRFEERARSLLVAEVETVALSSGVKAFGEALERKRSGDTIFNFGQRMLKLVNNLLHFTRTQLGSGLPIKVKKTDIVNICLRAVEDLRMNYPERSIEFSAKGNSRNSTSIGVVTDCYRQ